MIDLPQYCAVIRTLGTAGDKYQILLDSLIHQTHPPKHIFVYLAEGYEIPKETVGIEEIIRVKKGMVAQRALQYDEVDTEWILFLDDDISIVSDGVERMFIDTITNQADVCAFDGFPRQDISVKQRIAMALLLSSIPWPGKSKYGYRVNWIGTDMYNPCSKKDIAWSTTNSGNGFICRKKDFLKIHFDEDVWLDQAPYAIPEDKVMFYKMHLMGLKILTHYNSGFTHLDAGSSVTGNDKVARIEYSMSRNNKIFYELYVYPNISKFHKPIAYILYKVHRFNMSVYHLCLSFLGEDYKKERNDGYNDAKEYIKSLEFKQS